jgi:hypothetical protein
MQQISGISSGKNNKSCRIIHSGSKKISFAFFRFFMILYAIYKIQPKHFYYLGYQLQGGPRKELLFCNVVPGRAGRRGAPELSHSGGGFGRGVGGEGRGAHHRPICGRGRTEGRRWKAGRRRPGGLAAERLGPGCSGLGAGRGGAGEVGEALWQSYGALDAANCARRGV